MENENEIGKIIKCPYCGWEYTPDEIYVGDELIGKSKDIVKDPLGKILYKGGEPAQYIEKFECENCHNTFIIEATVNYKATEAPEEENFGSVSTSII